MAVQVKICGINSVESADAALRARADFAGLVFHPKSPRALNAEQAVALADRLRGRAKIVTLLVDPDDAMLKMVVSKVKPDILQLHGRESAARVSEIRAQTGLPVMKAIAIAEASDFAAVPEYEAVADMILFDAKAPANATREGGHGAAFDWQLLRGRNFKRPWLLAGGLTADNVAQAIAVTGAPGVDVSSGVESAPGVKDVSLIARFADAARNAQNMSSSA